MKNLTGLTWLAISENPIDSLKGIENLVNLTRISASLNNLTSIEEVKNLTNLKSLYVSTNYLENDDLPVLKYLVNLERLNVSDNCITDFIITNELREKGVDVVVGHQDPSRCN